MPAFPDDPYGFSTEDRIKWSGFAVKYSAQRLRKLNILVDLKFDDQTPLFNERELEHMLDVKIVVQQVMRVFYILISILVGLGIWAYFGKWMFDYRSGLSRGGWLTVGLILGIGLFATVSFWQFFTLFPQFVLRRRFLAFQLFRHTHPVVPAPLLAGCDHFYFWICPYRRGGVGMVPSTKTQKSRMKFCAHYLTACHRL